MDRIEYRQADRTDWPTTGVWNQEPDKIQWQDERTKLPCLMVRNGGGAWCGYVGVADGHPAFKVSYSSAIKLPKKKLEAMLRKRGVLRIYRDDLKKGDIRLESVIDVHGGLTFSGFCQTHTRADWEKWRARKEAWQAEAEMYPIGDSARRLREWAECFDDYDKWKSRVEATAVCHLPEKGEPKRVWWLGFDCSHAGDINPGYDFKFRRTALGVYRDAAYVRNEVRGLAKQVAAL